jgi:hypothetical protein
MTEQENANRYAGIYYILSQEVVLWKHRRRFPACIGP